MGFPHHTRAVVAKQMVHHTIVEWWLHSHTLHMAHVQGTCFSGLVAAFYYSNVPRSWLAGPCIFWRAWQHHQQVGLGKPGQFGHAQESANTSIKVYSAILAPILAFWPLAFEPFWPISASKGPFLAILGSNVAAERRRAETLGTQTHGNKVALRRGTSVLGFGVILGAFGPMSGCFGPFWAHFRPPRAHFWPF